MKKLLLSALVAACASVPALVYADYAEKTVEFVVH